MIRPGKILSLFGRVGWKQPTLSDYAIVDETNLASSTGLYFNSGTNLVTIKNLHNTQQDKDISDADFNLLLKDFQNDAILTTCNKITNGESLLNLSFNLYPYEKSFVDTIDVSSKFVGFKIEALTGLKNIIQIPWIELSFDTEKTFNIYLYNSNVKDPIQTKEVTTSAGESKIVNLEWYIANDTTYKGGIFYLGYFEDDLDGAKAYRKDWENSILKKENPYFYIEPIYTDHTDTAISVENVTYSSYTYGMNIGVNIYSDFTELLLQNAPLFDECVRMQMHEIALNFMRLSNRTNDDERFISSISFELYGNPELKIEGLFQKLERKIEDIKKMIFPKPRITRGTLS